MVGLCWPMAGVYMLVAQEARAAMGTPLDPK
jgi:hypothetical protein